MSFKNETFPYLKVLRLLIIASAALLWMTGCQGGSNATQTPPAANGQSDSSNVPAEEKQGGELRFAISVPIVGDLLDPHRSASPGNSRIQRSMFDSLVVEKEDRTFGPWLAERWEVSDDQQTYTFYLRQDVKFTDGTPFNAEAVKFNFERILSLEAPGLALSFIGPFESAEVVDEYTVRIHLSAPFSPFLRYLATENLAMVSPDAVEKLGEEFAVKPVGTGPFYLADYTAGTKYVLHKNEDYNWGPENALHQGPAYLDTLIIKIITEESTRVSALLSGDVEAIDTIPPQNLQSIQQDARYNLDEVELLNYNAAIHFNALSPPLDDKRLREALRLGLDLDGIVQTIYLGTYERAWSSLSPSLLGYDAELEKRWRTDVLEAERILDELGWIKGADGIRVKDGQKLVLNMIDFYANREKRLDVMTMVQNQWKTLGVQLDINVISRGEYTDKFKAGQFDLWIGSQYGPDPDGVFRPYLIARRGYTEIYDDPVIVELLDQGRLEFDNDKRAELYKQLQHHLFDQAYTIPVYVLPYTVAQVQKVNDLTFDSKGSPYFYDVWLADN